MTLIEQARALGAALQQEESYKRLDTLAKKADNDTNLQNKLGEFNMLRQSLSAEMAKTDKDAETMTSLDKQIRELYDEIMAMPAMVEYNSAKDELDKLLQSINYIITCAANGQDPMTCPETPPHCGGSCATCGGCG